MTFRRAIEEISPVPVRAALLRLRGLGFFGDYRTFEEAMNASGRYVSIEQPHVETIVSTHIGPRQQQVLSAFAKILTGAPLTVVDVGGGTGGYYAHLKGHVPFQRWTVFDLPEVIEGCRDTDQLKFVSDIAKVGRADVSLMSGFVQCMRDPYAALGEFARLGRYAILNRVPLIDRDRLTVQRTSYGAYPVWFLSARKFNEAIDSIGETLLSWDVPDDSPFLDGKRVTFRGMLVRMR